MEKSAAVQQFLSSVDSMQKRQWIHSLESQFGVDINEDIQAIINHLDMPPEGTIYSFAKLIVLITVLHVDFRIHNDRGKP